MARSAKARGFCTHRGVQSNALLLVHVLQAGQVSHRRQYRFVGERAPVFDCIAKAVQIARWSRSPVGWSSQFESHNKSSFAFTSSVPSRV
jgi:hypothetical protein